MNALWIIALAGLAGLGVIIVVAVWAEEKQRQSSLPTWEDLDDEESDWEDLDDDDQEPQS